MNPHAAIGVRNVEKTRDTIFLTGRPKQMSGSGRELVHSSELPVIASP